MSKLAEYIHRHRTKGYQDERIKKAMEDHGIHEEKIAHAFNLADNPEKIGGENKPKSKASTYLIAFIVLIFLCGMGLIGFSTYWLLESEECLLPEGITCTSKTKGEIITITIENTLEQPMENTILKLKNECSPSSVSIQPKQSAEFRCTSQEAAFNLPIKLSFSSGYERELEGSIVKKEKNLPFS